MVTEKHANQMAALMIDKYDSKMINHYSNCMKIEHIVNISDDSEDLKQLLWMASNNDHDAFIDQLSWMSVAYYKKNLPIHFVFPTCLTKSDRHKIHKMQSKGMRMSRSYYTYTDLNDNLNLFINKY